MRVAVFMVFLLKFLFSNDFLFSNFRIAMVLLSCVSLPVFNKWFSEETVLVVSEETVQFKTDPVQFGFMVFFLQPLHNSS
jgi:hypothetical protein